MSKAFGLAGARVGYLAAAPALVDALRVVRLPYHLSGVTQAVARAALRHSTALMAQVGSLRDERDATVAWLREQGYDGRRLGRQLRALRPVRRPARDLGGSARSAGCSSARSGPPGWLRVSIGTREEMAAFRAALVEVTAR